MTTIKKTTTKDFDAQPDITEAIDKSKDKENKSSEEKTDMAPSQKKPSFWNNMLRLPTLPDNPFNRPPEQSEPDID